MRNTRLTAVEEVEAVETPVVMPPDQARSALTSLLLLTLKTLSQRTVVALDALADVGMVGSVFALFMRVIPAPDQYQLVGTALYSIFVFAVINWRRRRHA